MWISFSPKWMLKRFTSFKRTLQKIHKFGYELSKNKKFKSRDILTSVWVLGMAGWSIGNMACLARDLIDKVFKFLRNGFLSNLIYFDSYFENGLLLVGMCFFIQSHLLPPCWLCLQRDTFTRKSRSHLS